MPLFQYGKGPIRNLLRSVGDTVRASGGVAGNLGGFLNNYTGWREQANIEAQWDREDTSLSRMVADAERAGINPMALVPGGGFDAGSLSSTRGQSPDFVGKALSIAQTDKQLALMDAQIESVHAGVRKTDAEIDSIRANTERTNVDVSYLIQTLSSRIRSAVAVADRQEIDVRVRELDREIRAFEEQYVSMTQNMRVSQAEQDRLVALANLETIEARIRAAWRSGDSSVLLPVLGTLEYADVPMVDLVNPDQVELAAREVYVEQLRQAVELLKKENRWFGVKTVIGGAAGAARALIP